MKLEDISTLEDLLNKELSTESWDGTQSKSSRIDSRVRESLFIILNCSLSIQTNLVKLFLF